MYANVCVSVDAVMSKCVCLFVCLFFLTENEFRLFQSFLAVISISRLQCSDNRQADGVHPQLCLCETVYAVGKESRNGQKNFLKPFGECVAADTPSVRFYKTWFFRLNAHDQQSALYEISSRSEQIRQKAISKEYTMTQSYDQRKTLCCRAHGNKA